MASQEDTWSVTATHGSAQSVVSGARRLIEDDNVGKLDAERPHQRAQSFVSGKKLEVGLRNPPTVEDAVTKAALILQEFDRIFGGNQIEKDAGTASPGRI
ncbi:hypothetical protein ONS95_006968 [Cadophora gregata]|uniref:uncharacterized protein n=1 Tax=Cadophora gregata TaxID=51156 RepID=UPI0026DBC908|nr:uncharacterized protein ONS95_006968 [Cadophora gregata]KAK0101818.1 hypothetical protein ONS95_006968 [Cadophora gregata]KAK0106164.1 hypothetical protein ONS96_003811 [Cadophora gregata f. sp. sojae]